MPRFKITLPDMIFAIAVATFFICFGLKKNADSNREVAEALREHTEALQENTKVGEEYIRLETDIVEWQKRRVTE